MSQAKQGLLFSTTRGSPELAVLDETVELSFFYKDALVPLDDILIVLKGFTLLNQSPEFTDIPVQ